jgi:hypothetical protein
MKFLNFFLLLWVIFDLLDPDPDSEYGSGSETLVGAYSQLYGRFTALLMQE